MARTRLTLFPEPPSMTTPASNLVIVPGPVTVTPLTFMRWTPIWSVVVLFVALLPVMVWPFRFTVIPLATMSRPSPVQGPMFAPSVTLELTTDPQLRTLVAASARPALPTSTAPPTSIPVRTTREPRPRWLLFTCSPCSRCLCWRTGLVRSRPSAPPLMLRRSDRKMSPGRSAAFSPVRVVKSIQMRE